MADARASGARGDRPCGFEFRRPDQNVEPGHPHGWPFHVEKRPARGKTMPRAGRKWREHGPGDHARRDRSDRPCAGRRDRSRARLQGALRERAEGVAQRPPHPHATSTSTPCLLLLPTRPKTDSSQSALCRAGCRSTPVELRPCRRPCRRGRLRRLRWCRCRRPG